MTFACVVDSFLCFSRYFSNHSTEPRASYGSKKLSGCKIYSHSFLAQCLLNFNLVLYWFCAEVVLLSFAPTSQTKNHPPNTDFRIELFRHFAVAKPADILCRNTNTNALKSFNDDDVKRASENYIRWRTGNLSSSIIRHQWAGLG